ncbi:hypothetical protein OJF2_08250 [Aquisphaera giovannonii]|uniref:Uncharacterized protein n=1 Tax=Aquisphaera giovannonii TaxID=406548 RepID=A0A5B9VX47_9BACT|nr:hypothetical protein OJF2_08250 [Aquisphaera giovannonii]
MGVGLLVAPPAPLSRISKDRDGKAPRAGKG